ncbi:hypothetical protein PGT21_016276 [Puccinia graminis f. sp. tritici]|uniref:Uncharacterized protein n=1 Tax=Puccinia graminis f. sp. tritici TaxID=56615 RepID=A0A5B0Q398_PUCGR|nr:hypothetical protein PGT21_016276 [Puccinia graminis f. sp. tritici]
MNDPGMSSANMVLAKVSVSLDRGDLILEPQQEQGSLLGFKHDPRKRFGQHIHSHLFGGDMENDVESKACPRTFLALLRSATCPTPVLVVRGNLLDGLVVPPLPFPSAPNSTPPNYPTLKFPPASHNVLRCHSLKLRLSPLRPLSVQVLLQPLMDRSLTASSASGSLRTPLPPLGAPAPCSPSAVYTETPIPQSAVISGVCQCPDSPQQAFRNLAHSACFSPLSRALES